MNIHNPVEYKLHPLGKAWLELPSKPDESDAKAVAISLYVLARKILDGDGEIPRTVVIERLENGSVRLHMPLVEPEL